MRTCSASRWMRTGLCAAGLSVAGIAWAQSSGAVGSSAAAPSPAPAAPATAAAATSTVRGTPAAGEGARFVESCNQSIEKGVAGLGCQGPIYRNELERLKQEALTTQNPQLLSFVGDAYQNQRSGIADISQAYRWYLLAAVRGDPRAMQQLSEMNRQGRGGLPQDRVKALGYARLAERLGSPGMAAASEATRVITELGGQMAAEEVALAERFSQELEAQVRQRQSGNATGAGLPAPSLTVPSAAGTLPGTPNAMPSTLAPSATTPSAPAGAAPLPGSRLPGTPLP
ncbi:MULTISPECIES: sel1 repeat family protein [unclassified Acidovorax]|uniref:sel1 repeat family protein n=1 Tax=unclassified Acidovorax TaxID=2684926 RepID=UPI002882FA33|nr:MULTISPECIES: sel1 repeat family protein [unclassified Acidovorax]